MKIGFLGGTFDPPHRGHTGAAQHAAAVLGLDLLLLIPTAQPPHKALPEDTAGTERRLEMTRLAAMGVSGVDVRVSDMEIRRGGKSYTADTVEELQTRYPGAELWLICGGDMLESLPDWYKSGWLTKNLGFAVYSRTGADTGVKELAEEYSRRYGMRALFMEAEPTVISSTELRSLLKKGEGASFLAREVYAYILKNRLYGVRPEPDALFELVKPWMDEKRLPHVIGCRAEAVKLAARWGSGGAAVKDAETAAILHDITKRFSVGEQLLLCMKYDIMISDSDLAGIAGSEVLLHARTAAEIAYKLFAVSGQVRDAIRWHTTGRADMSLLEKIVYLADTIEPTRSFTGVEEIRSLAYSDIDGALARSFELSLDYLEKRGVEPDRSTVEALEYLKNERVKRP